MNVPPTAARLDGAPALASSPHAIPAASSVTAPWTCPFCPLLCDGFGLRVMPAPAPMRLVGSDCPRAHAALARFGNEPAAPSPTVNGAPVALEQAIASAAALLAGSHQPLFGGLGTDVAGARALYRLACATGAISDAAGGRALMHGLRALQDRGAFTTTFAEVRTRADVVVCFTGSPAVRLPEFNRRCGIGEVPVAADDLPGPTEPVDRSETPGETSSVGTDLTAGATASGPPSRTTGAAMDERRDPSPAQPRADGSDVAAGGTPPAVAFAPPVAGTPAVPPRQVTEPPQPGPLSRAVPATRHWVVFDADVAAAQAALPAATPALSTEALAWQGDLFTTASVLNALVAGRTVRDAPAALVALAERLRQARYAVLVWEAAALPAHGALIVETLNAIVNQLNRHTRAAGLPLGGGDGAATVNQVFTWLGGMPLRSRAGPAGLEHEPLRFDTANLLADRAVDALLWVASFGTEPAPPPTVVPSVVLGHPATPLPDGARDTVFIPVSTPGIGSAGHLFRADGVVVLPLHAAHPDPLPSVADIVARLCDAVQALRRRAGAAA